MPSSPRDVVIEAMMCGFLPAGDIPRHLIAPARAQATAALDAMLAAIPALGLRVVPVQADQTQLIAARDWSAAKLGKPVGNDGATGCYGAMLASAPNVLGAADAE